MPSGRPRTSVPGACLILIAVFTRAFWSFCGFLPPVQNSIEEPYLSIHGAVKIPFFLSTDRVKKEMKNFAKSVDTRGQVWYHLSCAERAPLNARVVELVDSLASGASARKGVRVRLPPRAPRRRKRHIACGDFFKVTARSFCCGSSPRPRKLHFVVRPLPTGTASLDSSGSPLFTRCAGLALGAAPYAILEEKTKGADSVWETESGCRRCFLY